MSKKIYFISDAHLGAGKDSKEREQKLVRWLDFIKHDALAVYMLGDMIDFWFEYKKVVPRGFNRFFGKLAELTDSGIEVHWFIGNHDIWIFDYIPNELGVIVHKQAKEIVLFGKKFFLAHGDGLVGDFLSYRMTRIVFHNRVCQKLFACIHPRWAVELAQVWSNHHSRFGESPYLGEENEYLITFSKDYLKTNPSVNFFVFGHRHIVLDLPIAKNARVIILGNWIKRFSYGVFDGENLTLKDCYEIN